jgi:hypothetical protein
MGPILAQDHLLLHANRMCCSFQQGGEKKRPRHRVQVKGPKGAEELVWAGFARSEIRSWWERKKEAVPVDIEAESFAERAEDNGELVWDRVPGGCVLRGLSVPSGSSAVLKIVTRASTPDELEHFRHPRMPVCEEPLYTRAET